MKKIDSNEILFDPNEIFEQNGIETDKNEIRNYLNETEFYTLFINNLIYVYAKENSKIQFSTN